MPGAVERTVNTHSTVGRQSATDEFRRILHAFRSNDIHLFQALADTDHIVKEGRAASVDLLAALREDDAKQPLPTEAFEVFERRLGAHANGNTKEVRRDKTLDAQSAQGVTARAGAASRPQADARWYARPGFAGLGALLVVGLAAAAYYTLGDRGPVAASSTSVAQSNEGSAERDTIVTADASGEQPGISVVDWHEAQRELQAVHEGQQDLAAALASQRAEADALREELEHARAQLAGGVAALESAQSTQQKTQSDTGSAETARLQVQLLRLQSAVEDQKRASRALARESASRREALLTDLNELQRKERQLQQTLQARRTELESTQTVLAETQAALTERFASEERSAGDTEQLESAIAQLQTTVDEQKQQTELLEREQQDKRAALLSQLDELQLKEEQLRQTLQSRGEQLSVFRTELANTKQRQRRLVLEGATQASGAQTASAAAPAGEPPQLSEEELSEQQIAGLLARAKSQLALRRLTRPAGNNAYETYRQVLALEPAHPAATSGINEVKERYVGWANAATKQKNWSRARGYLEAALAIAPDDFAIQAALRDVIQTQESSRRVEELLAEARDELSSGNLIRPAGRNAWQSFTEVLALDAGNGEAKRGREAVMTRLEAAARDKQQEGKLREGLAIAEEGLAVFPDHTGLQALKKIIQQQLSKAAQISAPAQADPSPTADPAPAEQPTNEGRGKIRVFGTF